MNRWQADPAHWAQKCRQFLAQQMHTDAGHDAEHVRRVVGNATQLALLEGADLNVVLPAAWLHDCVVIAKDSPLRSTASRQAAKVAGAFLREGGYEVGLIGAIEHAIEAHSFSAEIPPTTLEAKVVQDADRLDAIGAIGIARALMIGTELNSPLYDAQEPFPIVRSADDRVSIIDHFYTKLLKLEGKMQTAAGKAEAGRRTMFMRGFLEQLSAEIGATHNHF